MLMIINTSGHKSGYFIQSGIRILNHREHRGTQRIINAMTPGRQVRKNGVFMTEKNARNANVTSIILRIFT